MGERESWKPHKLHVIGGVYFNWKGRSEQDLQKRVWPWVPSVWGHKGEDYDANGKTQNAKTRGKRMWGEIVKKKQKTNQQIKLQWRATSNSRIWKPSDEPTPEPEKKEQQQKTNQQTKFRPANKSQNAQNPKTPDKQTPKAPTTPPKNRATPQNRRLKKKQTKQHK